MLDGCAVPPTESGATAPVRLGIVGLGGLGGSGRVAHDVARGLAQRGHDVVMLTSPDAVFSGELAPWVRHEPVAAPASPRAADDVWVERLAAELEAAVLGHRLEVLSVHYGVGLAGAAVLARDRLRRRGFALRVCVTLHGTDVTHLARDPRQRRALRTAVLAADAVTAVSPSLCRAAMQQLQLPAAPSMIANGVDTDLFRPAPATDAAPSTHRSPVLCHASNFRAVKRPLDCIDLLAALRDHGTAPRLEMIGDGPLRAAAKEHARALGLVGEVRFVDPLPQARLAEHLRAADIALVTSESESFGLVALEAMACGTVMAGWQCAGLTDMLHDAPQLCAELLAPLGDLDGLVQRVQRLLVSETAYDAARHRCLDIGRNHFRREAQLDQYELLLAPSPGGHPAWAADART